MGSGITAPGSGSAVFQGIRDHSPGIWDHKPWDRDQQCFKGSGITAPGSGSAVFQGIRDHSPGIWDHSPGIWNHSPEIWDHKPWDRDQQCFRGSGITAPGSGSAVFQGIRDQVILDNIKNCEMCFTQEFF